MIGIFSEDNGNISPHPGHLLKMGKLPVTFRRRDKRMRVGVIPKEKEAGNK
jgi:hypothetical protein